MARFWKEYRIECGDMKKIKFVRKQEEQAKKRKETSREIEAQIVQVFFYWFEKSGTKTFSRAKSRDSIMGSTDFYVMHHTDAHRGNI
jgi:hypothetical protein